MAHTWVHKELITHGKLNAIETNIDTAQKTADAAYAAVGEAIEAAETANEAAELAAAAAESANEAVSAIYTDKNFLLQKNSNGTLTLIYSDSE